MKKLLKKLTKQENLDKILVYLVFGSVILGILFDTDY